MTPDRQNEIWAMLTQEERNDFQSMYGLRNSRFDVGYNAALDEIFGERNLTAQAEEKPKEDVEEIPLKIQAADSLVQMAKDEMDISDKADYAQFRLDLAKETAVAMIAANWEAADIPRDAVEDANEIVKRLKETEE